MQHQIFVDIILIIIAIIQYRSTLAKMNLGTVFAVLVGKGR